MSGRKNEFPIKEEQKLLKGNSEIRYHNKKKKRALRAHGSVFFITLFAGLVVFLFFALGVANEAELSFKKLAMAIISNDFMELSKDNSEKDSDADSFYSSVLDIINGIMIPSKDKDSADTVILPNDSEPPSKDSLYDFDMSAIPDGSTPIVPMDLSLSEYGSEYVHNSTSHSFNAEKLLNSKLDLFSVPVSASQSAPLVLIIHTHGTESYSEDGATYYVDDGSELARTEDITNNVVAVGSVIAQTLNENGIKTVHCTVMHDKPQYKDSYARAEETIREYLKKYPTIKLVIDVHRDSVIKSTGELVRPVTLAKEQAAAQVMCVVGASESCVSWQKNLTLALKLRQSLNTKYEGLCRPPYLRTSTYNQDIAPYSLLLEMGASGNSLVEAKRSAKLVAEELVKLFGTI